MNYKKQVQFRIKNNFIIIFLIVFLCGCESIKNVHFDGKSATYTHDNSDFEGAMLQAKAKCLSARKGFKHESTACGTQRSCFSTFICISD